MTCIKQLKNEGYYIVVMETTSQSTVYTDVQYPVKTGKFSLD